MTLEVCTTTLSATIAAHQHGAQRVELCTAIEQGGLTPNYGLIRACVQQTNMAIFVMIRHRQGGFVYADEDVAIMLDDIDEVKRAQAHGVVFGCLTDNNDIDIEQNKRLIERAKQHQLGTTFHRAFDFCIDPFFALEQIIALGFDRILTSGQQVKAIDGVQLIEKLIIQAKGRIEIMVGSGVNATNVPVFVKAGVSALHFTAHKKSTELVSLGMGNRMVADGEKIKNILEAI